MVIRQSPGPQRRPTRIGCSGVCAPRRSRGRSGHDSLWGILRGGRHGRFQSAQYSLAATAALAGGGIALAQTPAPRAKGPLVWLDMDQKALDDAYDQVGLCAEPRPGAQAQRVQQRPRARAARRAEAARLRPDADRAARSVRDRRSRTRRSTCSSTAAPGGSGAVKDYAFLAEMFVRAGAHCIALDFDGVEDTNGDLLPMADQVRRARRLGLQERQELRRRSEPHLRVRPVVRRASRRLRGHHRLGRTTACRTTS